MLALIVQMVHIVPVVVKALVLGTVEFLVALHQNLIHMVQQNLSHTAQH